MALALGHTNLIGALATVVGGSGWITDYPVTEIQSRYLFKRAKSTGNSATITIDLGAASEVGVVALLSHTLSAAATVRVQGGAFDSGVVTIYPGTDYAVVIAPETAQNWTITIADSAPFEVGRVFIGQMFSPATCVSWGYSDGLETTSSSVQALGGAEYFDIRAVRRNWSGTWEWLTQSEADEFKALMRRSDISGEVFFMLDADATSGQGETWWLGRFRQLSAIAHPYPLQYGVPVEVVGLL
jgi:hypothetical protein